VLLFCIPVCGEPMRLRLIRFAVMLLGAFLGYVVLVVLFNLENIHLYSLRSAITGETIPMRICDHPADKWIAPALFVTLCTVGASLAAVTFEAVRRVRQPARE
jgi:hypothetical protein